MTCVFFYGAHSWPKVFYVFLLIVAALGALVYLALFLSHVPGAKEERLGHWEPLPPNVDNWLEIPSADERICEERYLLSEASTFRPPMLIRQVRFRDPTTRAIVEILPEEKKARRRIKPS